MEREQEKKRSADKLLCQLTANSLLLLLLLNGFLCQVSSQRWKVKFANISAWTGSCAFYDCSYTMPQMKNNGKLVSLSWIHNPVYPENQINAEWKGTIVYHSESGINTNYSDRASFLGDKNNNCSLVIKDLRKEDSGKYGVRLRTNIESEKWMSFLILNVTDSLPDPTFKVNEDIKEEVQTTLTCSVDYFCPYYSISLSWEAAVNGTISQSNSGRFRTVSTLTFTPSWSDHNKNITCLLSTPEDGRKTSTSEILNVIYAPKNVQIYNGMEGMVTSFKKIMKEGEQIILRCAEESSNPPVLQYSWKKNNSVLKNGATFEIQNAAVKNTGKYTCEATNKFKSTTSKPVDIDIHYAPKETRIHMTEKSVKENDSLTLTCESQSNPPVTSYSWFKDRNLYPDHTEKEIHFHKLRDTDSGSYHCTVSNYLGNGTSSDVTVDVWYAPRSVEIFVSSPKKIKEGESVMLMCSYNSSNPAVFEYGWLRKKDMNTFNDIRSHELEIKEITHQDLGEYSCKARNIVGTVSSPFITINMLFAPKKVEIEGSYNRVKKEGEYVNLRCLVNASNPKVTEYTWYKNDSIYHHSHDDCELIFEKIQSADAGHYQCEAQNEIGKTRSNSVFVDVQYAPRNVRVSIIPPPDLIVELSDVTLVCVADANPKVSKYKWFHETQILDESGKNLYLKHMSQDLAGEYQCGAINSLAERLSEAVTISFSYSSTSIIRFTALGIGLFVCLVLLILLTLRFMLWKKQQRMPTIIQNPEDDRNDSFFVMNKKHSRDEITDERMRHNQASFHCASADAVNYATLQFSPIYAEEELRNSRISANNRRTINLQAQDASAIYSVVQKPRRSVQNADYENCGETKNTGSDAEREEDIHYASIVNLKCLQETKPCDWESGSNFDDTMVQYAALRHC
ncbi:B-cell receptor CD22 isoform X2 [Microcaecilia unicolor]|uniref:B-cell receptor CD22 n=1 Tax=Microcaecilia unicolor TaxID=1415580 RepID=A0A6P7Z0X3_9AMPH|nr:B-cell receptor CD22 isoform X2 [Microcaecilia unicolor]XP_030069405.1 B-cell receptor CD22 isoform X2 [Microcaecilia unicolor]XP_030069406.1 B-cell receptor CD22 isoform X2 [Microcaecilia unicolor]XP_030069407.1 B-cell receptor CD22 isoform X2 [Microcaecilia unicolor]